MDEKLKKKKTLFNAATSKVWVVLHVLSRHYGEVRLEKPIENMVAGQANSIFAREMPK